MLRHSTTDEMNSKYGDAGGEVQISTSTQELFPNYSTPLT